jgi:hypothetical protein
MSKVYNPSYIKYYLSYTEKDWPLKVKYQMSRDKKYYYNKQTKKNSCGISEWFYFHERAGKATWNNR